MELFFFLTSVCLMIGNLVIKVSPDSLLGYKLAYSLCLLILIFPILLQLWLRRIRKGKMSLFIVTAAIVSVLGLSVSLYVSWLYQYLPIFWGIFFLALCLQCYVSFASCLLLRKHVTNMKRYFRGLLLLLLSLPIELGAMIWMFVLAFKSDVAFDLSIHASVGIGGYAVGWLGVWLMRVNILFPEDKETGN